MTPLSDPTPSSKLLDKRRLLQGISSLATSAVFGVGRARAAADDTVRIGYITPRTGPFAPFAEADGFIVDQIEKALAGGIVIGNKRYKVEILVRDDQSNPDRSSNLAAQLINNENVDLMLAQGALGVVPVSQQCELNGVPCVTTNTPWQAWFFPLKGDPSKGFKSVFHFFWGIEDIAHVYADMWKDLPINKTVGTMFSNDVPGNAMGDMKTGMPAVFIEKGFKVVDIGRFPNGEDDFSNYIQAFKSGGVEIISGVFNPPDWATFQNQSAQMGFKPKVATIAKALLFPGAVASLGPRADRLSTEIWWLPAFPFRSSLTGQSATELAASYEQTTKRGWTQPLGVVHALFEVGIKALKASGDPKAPAAVTGALRSLKADTIIGSLDFVSSGVKNVSKMRLVGGQWLVGPSGRPDLVITDNSLAPEIPVQRRFQLL